VTGGSVVKLDQNILEFIFVFPFQPKKGHSRKFSGLVVEIASSSGKQTGNAERLRTKD
jgi:hypothetical protein